MIKALVVSTALALPLTFASPAAAGADRYTEARLTTDGLHHEVQLSAEGRTLTCVEFVLGASPWGKWVTVWQDGLRIAHWKQNKGETGCLGIDRTIKSRNQNFTVQVKEDYPGPWNPSHIRTITLR